MALPQGGGDVVTEDKVRDQQRIMAYLTPVQGSGGPRHTSTPAGRLGFVVINLDANFPFNATLSGIPHGGARFTGHRYSAETVDLGLGSTTAVNGTVSVRIPPISIEFWVQF
jgi:hypothetical protein